MNNKIYRKIGKKIKKIRKSKGISRKQLSQSLGWDIESFKEIESKKYPLPLTIGDIENIATCLDISIHHILPGKKVNKVSLKTKIWKHEGEVFYQAEEAECVNMFLNDLSIPKEINGTRLSLVGRVQYALGMIDYKGEPVDKSSKSERINNE